MSAGVAHCQCGSRLGAFNRSGLCRACVGRASQRRRVERARSATAERIEQIHDALREAAVAGSRCPTNVDLARRFGGQASHISTVVHDLARAGRFEVQQWGRTREIIFADGYRTAARAEWVRTRDEVARAFGFEPFKIVSGGRRHVVARARFAAAWVLSKRHPELSCKAIGRLMGGRDHSTVIHELDRADYMREHDGEFRALTDAALHDEPIERIAPVPIAALPKAKARAKTEVPPAVVSWCDQCQSRVSAERAAHCADKWCSVRQELAA